MRGVGQNTPSASLLRDKIPTYQCPFYDTKLSEAQSTGEIEYTACMFAEG